jgi:hypothetical protein
MTEAAAALAVPAPPEAARVQAQGAALADPAPVLAVPALVLADPALALAPDLARVAQVLVLVPAAQANRFTSPGTSTRKRPIISPAKASAIPHRSSSRPSTSRPWRATAT